MKSIFEAALWVIFPYSVLNNSFSIKMKGESRAWFIKYNPEIVIWPLLEY